MRRISNCSGRWCNLYYNHIEAIIKDEVEARMSEGRGPSRYSVETSKKNLLIVLESVENRTDLLKLYCVLILRVWRLFVEPMANIPVIKVAS